VIAQNHFLWSQKKDAHIAREFAVRVDCKLLEGFKIKTENEHEVE
jgi:hypothetical protein